MSIDKKTGGEEVMVRPPAHPVATLQGPFEESMVESVNDVSDNDVPLDALTRRTMLLDARRYQRVIAGRWKQKPGEKYHPLWKLVAQMSFGMHLLARNLAKSEDEVMKILQAHVDDIDGFLERTTEDFDLAQSDVHERLRCLKLPLAHGDVFDRMLEDRTFRASILDGNEKIEHIVHRTKRAMIDSLKDVQKGFDATNVLDKYLSNIASTWQRETPEHEAVIIAMLGNVEGWRKAFMELHLQGNKLGGTLNKLTEVVAEMQRRAAVVSRKILAQSQHMAHPLSQSVSISERGNAGSRTSKAQKPLPMAPDQHQPSRTSPRGTQLQQQSSRPSSGQNSNRDQSSGSASQSYGSPKSQSSKMVLNSSGTASIHASKTASPETPMQRPIFPFAKIDSHPESRNDIAIELPADIPEDVLRQAPVSVKNRHSMTLGLTRKDNADHRISSVYYPRALGDLLKVSSSPKVMLTPNKGTAVRSMSPVTDSDVDYFSAHERSPSIGLITQESENPLESDETLPLDDTPVEIIEATNIEQSGRRDSSMRSPAFTSHPSVMQMAMPPAELPAVDESEVSMKLRLRQESESSLGEPGPEITEAESEPDVLIQTIIEVPPEQPVQHEFNLTVNSPESEPPKSAALPPVIEVSQPIDSIDTGKKDAEQQQAVPVVVGVEERASGTLIAVEEEKPSQEPLTVDATSTEEVEEVRKVEQPSNPTPVILYANSKHAFVAELDSVAVVPVKTTKSIPHSPIELEASVQQFVLPPRSATVVKVMEKEKPSATIKKRADFFKLPSEQKMKPGLKPRDFGRGFGSRGNQEPIRPLKLKLERKDGKMIAVPAHSLLTTKKEVSPTSRINTGVITNLIDQISSTPAGSPIHERSASDASMSSNSAQIKSERSSRSFGPPESAPPPPGPGGRSMVNPDYANAAAFDGERKPPKRSSGGWKDLMSGALSPRNSIDSSSKTPRNSTGPIKADSARGSGNDMMTTAGKDILWFKEEGKNVVGV